MRRRAQPWLGTLVEIAIDGDYSESALQALFDTGFGAIRQIHALMSFHTASSDIARFNAAARGAVLTIDAHTHAVLDAAARLQLASDGVFDVRVASRLAEWEYLPAAAPVPAWQPQQQAYRLLPERRVEKLRNDWLDLGGIAKGYAVDHALGALQHCGVRQACVNAGGDLRVLGTAQEIWLRDPQQPQRMARRLHLQNQALATSGSYFSAKQRNGQALSALVHGVNGTPILSRNSYSVLAPQCLWADALTKLVAASGDAQHPCLAQFGAEAFII